MILVTGATGRAGSQVVRALLARGERVRAFVRDEEKARGMLGDRVELAVGDFAEAAAVRAALEGAAGLVLSCADDPRRVVWETSAVDAAIEGGVRRIVRLSTVGAAPGAPVAFWDWHGQIDEHVRASGVSWVVLQSSFYMTNLLAGAEQIALEGVIRAPLAGARIAMIDPTDVGAAAAAAATSGEADRDYTLTGPEPVGFERVAAEISSATGREVRFVAVDDEQARVGALEAGLPDFVAAQLVALYRELRRGVAAEVTETVESLTGSPSRTLAAFVADHVRQFEPTAAARG